MPLLPRVCTSAELEVNWCTFSSRTGWKGSNAHFLFKSTQPRSNYKPIRSHSHMQTLRYVSAPPAPSVSGRISESARPAILKNAAPESRINFLRRLCSQFVVVKFRDVCIFDPDFGFILDCLRAWFLARVLSEGAEGTGFTFPSSSLSSLAGNHVVIDFATCDCNFQYPRTNYFSMLLHFTDHVRQNHSSYISNTLH